MSIVQKLTLIIIAVLFQVVPWARSIAADDEPVNVVIICAMHVILHDNKIVSEDDIEAILSAAADKHKKILPVFMNTNGRSDLKKPKLPSPDVYKRLYDAGKINQMTGGIMSPRAGERYDRIRTDADLIPDEASKVVSSVVDENDKPVKGAEVFVLPQKMFKGGIDVYMINGRLRQSFEENVVSTDQAGDFTIYPAEDDVYIVAMHPSCGFHMTLIDNLKVDPSIELRPWAHVHGQVTLDDDMKQSVSFSCHPIQGVCFSLYETVIAEDGSYEERFLPPGKVVVQRGLNTGSGGIHFSVNQLLMTPGASEEIILGPIPDEQKKMAEEQRERNKQRK